MKYVRVLKGCLIIASLAILVLGINVAQMLGLVLLVRGRGPFMRFNIGCQRLFSYATCVGVKLSGNTVVISGDAPRDEDAIVMANHQAMIDIPLLWVWGLPSGRDGHMKWFVKDSFKYVPGPGWGLKFLHAIYVKRNWAKDASSIRKTFEIFVNGTIPFWVVIFPEGTRFTQEKREISRAYAARKKLPILDHVLIPKPKGAWASVQGLGTKVKCIYDVSIGFENGNIPTISDFFFGQRRRVFIHAVRIPIDHIDSSERDFLTSG